MKKVLVANRGEIACRIIRALHELSIKAVAVYSEADKESLHVKLADEAICIGKAKVKDSYLNISRIIAACEISGVDGVHPGYGFFSENALFAEIVERSGLIFIGPSSEKIRFPRTSPAILSSSPTTTRINKSLSSLDKSSKGKECSRK